MVVISDELVKNLESIANQVRRDIVKMTGLAGSGHPGGSLSSVEILVSLYFARMRHNPKDPFWPERDRFVLSKGHAAPALYSVLSLSGYFPREELWTLRKLGSRLQGHPSRLETPGVEASTGSLGIGFAIAQGMALAGKLDRKDYRVFVLLGDGEIQEGMVWEVAMSASFYRLDNFTAIIDYNGMQLDGFIHEIVSPYPLVSKWRAFGWEVFEVDGHDFYQILEALNRVESVRESPTVIIAHTVKGKGVSFMENNNNFHGKAPTSEEVKKALMELGEVI
ncbi:MAG: transketolase [Synergistetes bacterium]|nr:transketolase [Synergistota bacterium]MDK2871092.1 transketolase [bacterium]